MASWPGQRAPGALRADAVAALNHARRALRQERQQQLPPQPPLSLVADTSIGAPCVRFERNQEAAAVRLGTLSPCGSRQFSPSPPSTPRRGGDVGGGAVSSGTGAASSSSSTARPRSGSATPSRGRGASCAAGVSAQRPRCAGVRQLSPQPPPLQPPWQPTRTNASIHATSCLVPQSPGRDRGGDGLPHGSWMGAGSALGRLVALAEEAGQSDGGGAGLPPGVAAALADFVTGLHQRSLALMGFAHPHMDRLATFVEQQVGSLVRAFGRAMDGTKALLKWQAALQLRSLWDALQERQRSLSCCKRRLGEACEAERDALERVAKAERGRAATLTAVSARLAACGSPVERRMRLLEAFQAWRSRQQHLAVGCCVAACRLEQRQGRVLQSCFAAWAAARLRSALLQLAAKCRAGRYDAVRSAVARSLLQVGAARRASCFHAWARCSSNARCGGAAGRAEEEARAAEAMSYAWGAARQCLERSLVACRQLQLHTALLLWMRAASDARSARGLTVQSETHAKAEASLLHWASSSRSVALRQLRRADEAARSALLRRCMSMWAYQLFEAHSGHVVKTLRSQLCQRLGTWDVLPRPVAIRPVVVACLLGWQRLLSGCAEEIRDEGKAEEEDVVAMAASTRPGTASLADQAAASPSISAPPSHISSWLSVSGFPTPHLPRTITTTAAAASSCPAVPPLPCGAALRSPALQQQHAVSQQPPCAAAVQVAAPPRSQQVPPQPPQQQVCQDYWLPPAVQQQEVPAQQQQQPQQAAQQYQDERRRALCHEKQPEEEDLQETLRGPVQQATGAAAGAAACAAAGAASGASALVVVAVSDHPRSRGAQRRAQGQRESS
eukprot:TRINITY_DN8742_c0_g1_i3.p1 TRINITY_DN8742_c0_g1~~TRINITY_DN8742_c0_g1_i3.p1  ORF type:complete len:844 (+),score=212.76 TRINITY_DN8742_c0_g1_i3:58-2589(+)